MLRPDYNGGGFLNLIASLAESCGARPRHPALASLAPAELASRELPAEGWFDPGVPRPRLVPLVVAEA